MNLNDYSDLFHPRLDDKEIVTAIKGGLHHEEETCSAKVLPPKSVSPLCHSDVSTASSTNSSDWDSWMEHQSNLFDDDDLNFTPSSMSMSSQKAHSSYNNQATPTKFKKYESRKSDEEYRRLTSLVQEPMKPMEHHDRPDITNEEKLQDLTKSGEKYPVIQKNGQRIYGGPPPNWKGRSAPPKGTEIFVGKLPRNCFEDELVPLFSKVGQIYELRLMMDFSGSNRGYFFVKYSTPQEAKRAIATFNNYEIQPGRRIGVCLSVDNRKLWISGLPKGRTADEIKADLEDKTPGIVRVILYPSHLDKTRNRPYAFVEYENHRAAALARRKLVPGGVTILNNEIYQVDWAQPEVEVDNEVMEKVRVLFVRNLSPVTTENKLSEYFENLGGKKLERVRKTRDFAFLHFPTRECAELALRRSEGLVIDECAVEVTWSKPVDKDVYNTRKELTKLFSTGLPPSGYFNGGDGTIFSPTTGAPGTNPPRNMVLKMLSAQQTLLGQKFPTGMEGNSRNWLSPRTSHPAMIPYGGELIHDRPSQQHFPNSNVLFGFHNNGGFSEMCAAYGYGAFCMAGQSAPAFYGRYPLSHPANQYVDSLNQSLYQLSLN